MKQIISLLFITMLLTTVSQAKVDLVTLPGRDTVQITIYNSADMTLVRESRALTLKDGQNKLQFSWANTLIDPTSLEMLPKANADRIDIADLTYPPRVKNLGLWNIDSRISAKVPVEISYLTSGLSWRAFYMGTLTEDEKTMRLQGYVRVTNNSGEDYENAQTRLIVGKVHLLDRIADLARREHPYGRPGERPIIVDDKSRDLKEQFDADPPLSWGMPRKPKEIRKEGLSEYFLYTIEGRETIPTGWSKRLISFDIAAVPVMNLYKYEEERYGNSVVRFLSFKNDQDHKLGETPIPGGSLKVYRGVDDKGHLSYSGQSSFKYIPVDEDVELNLGAVGNVVVEPKLMDFKTANYVFDPNGNISTWDEIREFQIQAKNTRDIPVKIEIRRNFNTADWTLEENGDFDSFEKIDKSTVLFALSLDPRTEKKFSYILTTRHKEIYQAPPENPGARISTQSREFTVLHYGLQFDGRNTYVEIKDNPVLDLSGPLTLEAWIKFQEGGTENPRIISKGWEAHDGYEFLLQGTGKQRKLQFGATNLGRFDSLSYLSADTWYHVAVTYDNIRVKLLVNGQPDGIYKARGNISVNNLPLNFGRNSQTHADRYKGEIAMVRLWSRALSENEIRRNLIAHPHNSADLAGWWSFTQYRNSASVPDISGHGNKGHIYRGQ